jgi:hypothetical protein
MFSIISGIRDTAIGLKVGVGLRVEGDNLRLIEKFRV